MKPKLSDYRKRIAKMRTYLSLLAGADNPTEVLKFAALLTYELNRMPYAHPKQKRN